MKKMLFMCLVAASLVGCNANIEPIENTEISKQTENVDSSSTENESIELTETESMENFNHYMKNNEVEESKEIILPPYTEDDFVLFQVEKGLSDSDKTVIHLQNGITEDERSVIQSYIDIINSYVESGKEVNSLDLKKDDANYHLYVAFQLLYADTTITYYNTQNALDIYLYDDAMIVSNESQGKEWYYKK